MLKFKNLSYLFVTNMQNFKCFDVWTKRYKKKKNEKKILQLIEQLFNY